MDELSVIMADTSKNNFFLFEIFKNTMPEKVVKGSNSIRFTKRFKISFLLPKIESKMIYMDF